MHYTRNWRSFSLSPAAGERAGERGPPVSSIPRSYQDVTDATHVTLVSMQPSPFPNHSPLTTTGGCQTPGFAGGTRS